MIKVKKINFLCPRKLKRYTRTGRILRLPFYGEFGIIYSENYIQNVISDDTIIYVSLGEYGRTGDTSFNFGHKRPKRFYTEKLKGKDFRSRIFNFVDDCVYYNVLYALFPTKQKAAEAKLKI